MWKSKIINVTIKHIRKIGYRWNLERSKKIHCKYYRYADDTFITCYNEAEQKFIATAISKFAKENLSLKLNTDKSHFKHNEIHLLGFKLIKNKRSIQILIDNLKKYTACLKGFKFNNQSQCQEFIKCFRGIFNYFDIANNIGELLTRITLKLYYRSKHSARRKVSNVYKY